MTIPKEEKIYTTVRQGTGDTSLRLVRSNKQDGNMYQLGKERCDKGQGFTDKLTLSLQSPYNIYIHWAQLGEKARV